MKQILKIGCSRTKRIKTHPTVNVVKLLISVKHKSCYDATKVTVNIVQFMKTKTTYND